MAEAVASAPAAQPIAELWLYPALSHPRLGVPAHRTCLVFANCSRRLRSCTSSVKTLSICTTTSLSFVRAHFVPNLWMNNIAGSAEVRNHRYGATRESFEDHACAVVTNGWKDKHIGRSHPTEDFAVT